MTTSLRFSNIASRSDGDFEKR